MRAYKLPNGEWIDLDHVQAISEMWRSSGDWTTYHICNLTLAFQNEPKRITLSSFSNYGKYGEILEKLEKENHKTAEANYRNLLAAWKFV